MYDRNHLIPDALRLPANPLLRRLELCRTYLFPDVRLWAVMLTLAVLDGVWIELSSQIAADSDWIVTILACTAMSLPLCLLAHWSAEHEHKRILRILRTIQGLLYGWAATHAFMLFNALAMSLPFPILDNALHQADLRIGFEWRYYLDWVLRHPGLIPIFHAVYVMVYAALPGLLILHSWAGENRRAIEVPALLTVSAIGCSVFGLFFPALGAMETLASPDIWAHFPPMAGREFVAPLTLLKAGQDIMLDTCCLPGLTAFPSYHATLAALTLYCARGRLWVFTGMFFYVLVMLASTPIFGGHYAVDILAGFLLALASIVFWRCGGEHLFTTGDNAAWHDDP